MRIKDGKATYVSRYVKTARLKQEEYFGGAKFMKVKNDLFRSKPIHFIRKWPFDVVTPTYLHLQSLLFLANHSVTFLSWFTKILNTY